MDLAAGDNAVLVLAVEGAFATGAVVPGDQVTFGRYRITIDAPVAGNYTVTTPDGRVNISKCGGRQKGGHLYPSTSAWRPGGFHAHSPEPDRAFSAGVGSEGGAACLR